jgi:hypothetical protein
VSAVADVVVLGPAARDVVSAVRPLARGRVAAGGRESVDAAGVVSLRRWNAAL